MCNLCNFSSNKTYIVIVSDYIITCGELLIAHLTEQFYLDNSVRHNLPRRGAGCSVIGADCSPHICITFCSNNV